MPSSEHDETYELLLKRYIDKGFLSHAPKLANLANSAKLAKLVLDSDIRSLMQKGKTREEAIRELNSSDSPWADHISYSERGLSVTFRQQGKATGKNAQTVPREELERASEDRLKSKSIAFRDGTIERENLPYPIVLYPGFYGAFFGFQEKENSSIWLCACAKEAIENYVRIRLSTPIGTYADPRRMFILDSMYFPVNLVETLLKSGAPNNEKIVDSLLFRRGLCHECNGVTPKLRYCHPMYGAAFKQTYGWYINKQAFEWGISPILPLRCLEDKCPLEVRELFDEELKHHSVYEISTSETLRKKWWKQERTVMNAVENSVREKFGAKRIGEAWVTETILYYMVKSLINEKQVLRHYRPDFLEGLELDIFIPSLNLGVEYQGLQHFEPVEHWGGEEAFGRRRERDIRKKHLCTLNNVRLVCFSYNEQITEELVKARLGL